MMIDLITTLIGMAVPAGFLLIVWIVSTPMAFSTATLTFSILATLGMGEIIPLFGNEVVGGSTYFPATFLAIALCARTFGLSDTLDMLNCISRGMLLFCAAQFRWVFFALYAPDQTTHSLHSALLLGRNAVLMTGIVYFGGLLILASRKMMSNYGNMSRFTIPVFIDIILMTPISLWATYTMPDADLSNWNSVVFWTFVTRLTLPVIVISGVYLLHVMNWKVEEKD